MFYSATKRLKNVYQVFVAETLQFLRFFYMYGEKEVLHLMALKEVNAKEPPEMTQEEVMGLQYLDDSFVLAQAERCCR